MADKGASGGRKVLPADVTLIEKIGEALYETKDSKEYGAI